MGCYALTAQRVFICIGFDDILLTPTINIAIVRILNFLVQK